METTDHAALHPTKQKIRQPLEVSIAISPPPAALAEPQEGSPLMRRLVHK